ncbi:MAG: 30S ribosomal protein S7 [Candidatus Nanoarchaeia archaeon]|nr:30S ribosomal protein S7 [Candidatus Nanoarchaeia archaeon]
MEEVKIFGEWTVQGVIVSDTGLKKYINLEPVHVPRSGGRHEAKKFWKSRLSIVERLMNKLMTPGHKGKKHMWTSKVCTGKSATCYKIIKETFSYINKKTGQNPIQILVKAIEHSAPREEVTVIEYGGIRHPKSVDVAPQRRVDLALRWLTQGAYGKTVRNKKPIGQILGDEIILAANNEKCFSIQKKVESERQAAASR